MFECRHLCNCDGLWVDSVKLGCCVLGAVYQPFSGSSWKEILIHLAKLIYPKHIPFVSLFIPSICLLILLDLLQLLIT